MFIVLHVTIANGMTAKEIFDFPVIEQALEKYHALLAYDFNAAVLPNLNYFMAEILDDNGLPAERKSYVKPRDPAEPEIEEEVIDE